VAGALYRGLADPPGQLDEPLLARLRARDALLGRAVRVTGGEELQGTALGFSPAGALLLRDPGGALRSVHAGTVRLAEGDAAEA
jgi:BirA family biotin operon repressor/biotin-[acetyl-CoA-carboxylase] ligase